MDLHILDPAIRRYFSSALATSSHKTYKAAENKYLTFCNNFSLQPLPSSEALLCYFVACLGQQGLAHSTIRTYLSGVRQLQISHGFPELSFDKMPRLRQILKGVQVEQGKQGKSPRCRLPITPAILRKLRAVWLAENPSFNDIMLWAACAVTFFSFCRSGEVTVEKEDQYDATAHLSYGDIAVDNPAAPAVISIMIKKSKTDQGRKGVKVFIGKTSDDLCPVAALLFYLPLRGAEPGPLFRWESGIPLSKSKFVEHVREGLTKAGLPVMDYAGHSFRIGAATTAAVMGLEDSAIQTLGRWESSSYKRYIRQDPHFLASLSPTLARCQI